MSSEYSTIQQHQPLRVPAGWDRQEKALIVQLDEVFDDIYRRFGRLRFEDMNKSFRKRIENDEGTVAEIAIKAGEIELAVQNVEGQMADVLITVDGIETTVSNMEGQVSTLTQTVNGFETRVSNVEGGLSSISQTVGQIELSVQNKYDKVSGISITAAGIELSGSKYIKLNSGNTIEIENGGALNVKSGGNIDIKSGGTFTVASGNFGIDAQGNVTFNGGGTFYGALSAATGTFAGDLRAAGGTFTGELTAATGTFVGELSAATGTFAGNLNAAGGTFKGELSAATGTFAGELSAATGTFKGSLSAATGTFNGTLSANTVSAITLTGDQIVGGTLMLGGANNGNGQLQIQDANGVLIGYWNKDGIYAKNGTFEGALNGATGTFAGTLDAGCITSGTINASNISVININADEIKTGHLNADRIKGGTLTLGGSNNINGSLSILNANGTEVGYWNNNGVHIVEGTSGSNNYALWHFDNNGLWATKWDSGTSSSYEYGIGTNSVNTRLNGNRLPLTFIGMSKGHIEFQLRQSASQTNVGAVQLTDSYAGGNNAISLYSASDSFYVGQTYAQLSGIYTKALGSSSYPVANAYITNLTVGGTNIGTALASKVPASKSGSENIVECTDNNVVLKAGGYKLKMQSDGNLVLYNASNTAIWSTGTGGQ